MPPADPKAAAALQSGMAALSRGDAAAAISLIQEAARAAPEDHDVWLAMAYARNAGGDREATFAALDRALHANAASLRALIMKAQLLDQGGQGRAALAYIRRALEIAAPIADRIPPDINRGLAWGREKADSLARDYEAFLRGKLEEQGMAGEASKGRFAEALDILLGRSAVFYPQPRYFYYPGLPVRSFYDPDELPWLAALEAGWEGIRDEFLEHGAAEGFQPYVEDPGDRPVADDHGMVGNPDWSAFYLIRDGQPRPGLEARFPRTFALMQAMPLTEAPERLPNVLFSRMAPNSVIPPHNGLTNARLICHLGLVVPPDCGFRVGGVTREWREGRAWAFDDTIEHEAWNRSGQARTILLFEAWRPELSDEERTLIATLISAVEAYAGEAGLSDERLRPT